MPWMSEALRLAKKGEASCPPNPMVGCVIVKNHHVVGRGYHQVTGGPHAETLALREAGAEAEGSDMYVTLEPCSHLGHTPPCVDAVIASGIKTVHVAICDPNPLVSGTSTQKMRSHGLQVIVGEKQEEAYLLNEAFFHYITHKSPFVIAKWAMTLEGRIASFYGHSKWITSLTARKHAHHLRSKVSAIMVGARTLRLDNPQLTVRLEAPTRQPRPLVISASGIIPMDALIMDPRRQPIVITSNAAPVSFLKTLEDLDIAHHVFALKEGHIVLRDVLKTLATVHHIQTLLVEGGSALLTRFHEEDLIHQIYAYIAPKIMGGAHALSPLQGKDSLTMKNLHSSHIISLDPDVCMIAKTQKSAKDYKNFLDDLIPPSY